MMSRYLVIDDLSQIVVEHLLDTIRVEIKSIVNQNLLMCSPDNKESL